MIRNVMLIILCLVQVMGVHEVVAESKGVPSSAVRVLGRTEAVVTDPMIHLGDIAQIDSPNLQDDEAIIQLKRIVVGKSPRAGEAMIVDGSKVLERLRDEGVRLNSIRYSLPRQMTVTRAYREVKQDELERALAVFIGKSSRQFEVKQVVSDQPVRIPTDSLGLEVVNLETTQPGHVDVDYRSVAGSDEVRFQLKAIADEWRMMPVAARPLSKGGIVTATDVQLKKVNGTAIGRDALENIGDVVGHTLTKDIGQGEMFRTGSLIVPPVIAGGSKVTLVFRAKRLEATASGVALESGVVGQEIKVRNEQSKKTVTGRVVEPGIVAVGAQ